MIVIIYKSKDKEKKKDKRGRRKQKWKSDLKRSCSAASTNVIEYEDAQRLIESSGHAISI